MRSSTVSTSGPDGYASEVASAQEALIANTVTALYADPAINAEVVDQALSDWTRTAILLGGDANDRRGGHELSDCRNRPHQTCARHRQRARHPRSC